MPHCFPPGLPETHQKVPSAGSRRGLCHQGREQPGSQRRKGHHCCARQWVSLCSETSGTCIQCLPHEGKGKRNLGGECTHYRKKKQRGTWISEDTHLSTHSAHAYHIHTGVHTCTHKYAHTLTCTQHTHTSDTLSVSNMGT